MSLLYNNVCIIMRYINDSVLLLLGYIGYRIRVFGYINHLYCSFDVFVNGVRYVIGGPAAEYPTDWIRIMVSAKLSHLSFSEKAKIISDGNIGVRGFTKCKSYSNKTEVQDSM